MSPSNIWKTGDTGWMVYFYTIGLDCCCTIIKVTVYIADADSAVVVPFGVNLSDVFDSRTEIIRTSYDWLFLDESDALNFARTNPRGFNYQETFLY